MAEREYDARLVLEGGYDLGHGIRLSGKIYDDTLTTGSHPFPDGTVVSTSPVQIMIGRVWVTKSGTRYRIEFEEDPK
jgi:hypothetical protein